MPTRDSCTLAEGTREIEIAGVEPDGMIDGLAIGMFYKDAEGYYCLDRSDDPTPHQRTQHVGIWPLWFHDDTFFAQVPQVTDGHGRKQAQISLMGAEYLGNGRHMMELCGLTATAADRQQLAPIQMADERGVARRRM